MRSYRPLLLSVAAAVVLLTVASGGCSTSDPQLNVPRPASYNGMDNGMMRAIRTAVHAVEGAPDKAGAWKQLCMIYQANEFPELAIDCYGQAVERWPEQAWYRYQLARVHGRKGDSEGAVREMTRMIEVFKFYSPAFVRLGEWRIERGELDEAAENLSQALLLSPDEPAAQIAMARLHIARNEAIEAVEILEPLVEQSPDQTFAYLQLGAAYEQLGRRDEAQVASRRGKGGRRSFTHDPWADEVNVFAYVGESSEDQVLRLMATGRAAEAVPMLEQMRNDNPESLYVLTRLGQALIRSNRAADALVILQQAGSLYPRDFSVQFEMASAYELSGDADRALERIDKAIELDGEKAAGYNRKGGILHSMKRFEEAALAFGQAVELEPGNARFLRAAGDSWSYAKQNDRALENYYMAVAIDPADPELFVRIGIAALRLRQIDDAERALNKAIELGPRDPRSVDALLKQVQLARKNPPTAESGGP